MTATTLRSSWIEVGDNPEAVLRETVERGWGDGLPVVPATEDRVVRMIAGSGLPGDHVVAEVPPLYGSATIEKIAINAVSAGCLPEYMPVLVAAVAAMSAEDFNLYGIQATTNPAGVALVVNGPIATRLGINAGRNCLGPGWRTNATIGRAIRLIMLNVGGGRPEEVDKAVHGYPGKYGMCLAEDEQGSAWEPLHVERGFASSDSVVTVVSANSALNVLTSSLRHIDDMLELVADALNVMGTNNVMLGSGEPLILLTPGHARLASEAGMDKLAVKRFIYRACGFPEERLPRRLMRRERIEPVTSGGTVRAVRRPEDLMIVVAGGPEPYQVMVLPTFGHSWAISQRINELP